MQSSYPKKSYPKCFISPPFGNYVPTNKNIISIKGSYTLEPRGGLITQILTTLRYSYEHGGWRNKIGLRNKGIDYAISQYKKDPSSPAIYSIAILSSTDIPKILEKLPDKMNVELNISCPNTEKNMISDGLKPFLNPTREWCAIKLSPHTPQSQIDMYYDQGFRQFHCSNTLPTPRGGVSGSILRKYTNKHIDYIREKYPDAEIIAGGGIQTTDDACQYLERGANHIAVSTLLFCPYKAAKFFYNWL